MSSMQSIVGTLPGYIIYFATLLLTATQSVVLFRTFKQRLSSVLLLLSLLHFVVGFFLLSVLLDYSYNVLIENPPEIIYDFELEFLSLPWLLYAGFGISSAVVICFYGVYNRRYRDTHLTVDAIRETIDLLPTALMVSGSDGTVLLSNLKMNELCREVTGEMLSDAGRFGHSIEKAAAEKTHVAETSFNRQSAKSCLVHTPSGETWQFTKSTISLDGKEYDQLTAADMTAQYQITQELSQKNRHLKEVQDRMKTVAAQERSLLAAREVMNARVTVHNRMGGVLLSGKYYLDHPENVKEDELLHLLEYNNDYLLREAQQPEEDKDLLQEALKAARQIGAHVEIKGELPQSATFRVLLAQAIEQCAANAVRHAGGDHLDVEITQEDSQVSVAFTNNGRPPAGPITETGGLVTLRKSVEEVGGTMTVQSAPVFLLTILLDVSNDEPLSHGEV